MEVFALDKNYNNRLEFGQGAILGALIGDAAGATLEFIGRPPTADDVCRALAMKGGGVWQTAAGQITDDGELTLALCQALADTDEYSPNQAARFYRRWRLSEPFDIGFATSSALAEGELHSLSLAETLAANAQLHNRDSQANGALMRVSPLGVWSARFDLDTAIAAARSDARLTHPHINCQWANVAYVVAIRHLLLNPGDHRGAFTAGESAVPTKEGEYIHHYFEKIHTGQRLPDCTTSAGYVLIALTHAFYHLYHATPFTAALGAVLAGGGDTDTNACITGGLLGALWGNNQLPAAMRSAVLHCDVKQGQPRPAWLQSRHVEGWIRGLLGAPGCFKPQGREP